MAGRQMINEPEPEPSMPEEDQAAAEMLNEPEIDD